MFVALTVTRTPRLTAVYQRSQKKFNVLRHAKTCFCNLEDLW